MAPTLVFAWGNASRGDDGLGPELAARLEQRFAGDIAARRLEVLTDYQLQVEHTLDLVGRERVFFVDATAAGDAPFTLSPVAGARDASFTSHVLTPRALLHAYAQVFGAPLPECWVLAIRGADFELGVPMSAQANANLAAALDDLSQRLAHA